MFLRNGDKAYQATRRHIPKVSNFLSHPEEANTLQICMKILPLKTQLRMTLSQRERSVSQMEPHQIASTFQAINKLYLRSCGHDPVICKHVGA
jgi:hypothetical protein